jgi:ABC-2 type transport system ATP-binding protein
MPEPAILVDKLTKLFGSFVAVDHVSFEIQTGEIVGFVGPNGSGKTTTIRMLLGLLSPSDGKATVLGFDSFRESEQVRASCGYMSQKFAIYDDLTVWENLQFYGGVYGITDKSRIRETMAHVGLTSHESDLTRGLSAGWRQRLALAIALVHQPKLLFLDEPTSGVDPNARRAFWDLIYELAGEGVTVFVTTHYMDEAEYCGRIGIMRDGKLLAMDTPTELKKSVLPGPVWEVFTEPLAESLSLLASVDGVLRAGLAGDHLRTITDRKLTADGLKQALKTQGVSEVNVLPGEPTLEDVFLTLAKT